MREGAADLSSIFLAREGRRRLGARVSTVPVETEDYFVLSAGETRPLADHFWLRDRPRISG